jgi:nucleotide-binding universal stress UspA family protein
MTQPSARSVAYRILVSLAHDDSSNPAFAEAVQLVHGHDWPELHVVHVVEEKIPASSALGIELLDQQLEEAPKALEARLAPMVAALGFRGHVIGHLRVGKPAQAILQAAVDIHADVIVMGTHHRSGLERLVLGSVAEQVMREAHCPVMVVTTKNYTGLARSHRMDPPCAECMKVRAASGNKTYWCERHGRPHIQTHVMGSSDRTSTAPNPGRVF